MKIVHLSMECYPVAKVGGLADVVGALPKYQSSQGIEASVVIPWYDNKYIKMLSLAQVHSGEIKLGTLIYPFEILKENEGELGFDLYLIRIPGLLDRPEVYGYEDDSDQYIAFQHAVLQWMSVSEIQPDLLHCHDHHTGLVPFFVEHCNQFQILKGTPTVFTIHNAEYQGWMSWNKAALMPKYEEDSWGLLDWDDRINPMAAAIKCCWTYTTVSQGYLHEICSQAVLGPLLYAERKKSYGILNGIDINVWDPSVDKLIDVQFTEATLVSGKTKNKKNFCKLFKLDNKRPLFGFIGRFAIEKGADLLPEFIQRMNEGDGKKINIVVLGSGNPKIEEALRKTQSEYSDTFALVIGYDEPLAHKLYASADFIMMPSRVEPCGLNQLYAMRYGAIPIVRQTGGLGDTVQDISDENGNGFVFPLASIEDLTAAIDRATAFYYDNPTAMHDLMKHNMMLDHSWDKSVDKYHDLYRRLLDK